jgi:putative membrane protein
MRSAMSGWRWRLLLAAAFLAIVVREAYGLLRLATIEKLHRRAEEAIASDERAEGRAVASDLVSLLRKVPQLARGAGECRKPSRRHHRRRRSRAAHGTRTDASARSGGGAARFGGGEARFGGDRREPARADRHGLCAVTTLALVRRLALLYGGRPGALGLFRLMRLSIAHLAVTGGLAAGDSLIHQMFGHGIAAKLSAKLGEGVLNGLLTARLGLAAIEVTRPLPFNALPRPAMGTVAGDLLKSVRGSE